MSKAKRVTDLNEWKREDVSDSRQWRKRAIESFRFYTAIQQWHQADLDKLANEGRPALTIPLITSIVNTVVGHQIDNEQQFRLYPRRGGTSAVAALGTELLKHTMDDCNGNDHTTEVFQDGAIGGVGVIGIQERRDDINKELLVRKKSPFNVIFDQSCLDYDFDDKGRRVFEEVWLSKEEISLGFHKSIKDIEQANENPRFHEEQIYTDTDDYSDSSTGKSEKKGLYCVNKSYWRRWEKQVYFVELQPWHKRLLHGPRMIQLAKQFVEAHTKQQESLGRPVLMKIVERADWKLYKTWFVGEMELLHVEDPWNGINDFPIKPFYPYWADGHAFGLIDGNKDAQRYLNKMFSKELEPNLGWWVKDSSDTEAMKDLAENGGKPNFVLRKDKFGSEAGRNEPPKPFFEHELVVQRLERFMNLIAGVDPTLRGHQKGGKESGKALEKRVMAGIMVTKIVHKNFNRTLRKVGKFLWEAVRQKDEEGQSRYYSQEEIVSIVQEASLKQFITNSNGRQGVDLGPFFNENIGNYGVKVSTSPNNVTIRRDSQDYLLRIAEVYAKLYGVPVIPPEFLIKLSDISDKDELIEYLRKLQVQPANQPADRKAKTA